MILCINELRVLVYPGDNLPCPLLREVMARGDAVALLLGIVSKELGYVLLAKEFVAVAKEGMHHGAVLLCDVLLYPMVVGCIGAYNLVGHVYQWEFLAGIPAGVNDYAGYSVERERDECSQRTAHNEVYAVLTDVAEYLLTSLGKVRLRVGKRLHHVALGHQAPEHGAGAPLGTSAIAIYVQDLLHMLYHKNYMVNELT